MEKTKFGFLENYFHYHHFEISPDNEFYEELKTRYPNEYNNYKYGACLIENETRDVLTCRINDSKMDFSSFNFYLNQLPNLELNTVALLFVLICDDNQSRLLNNAFQIPEDYPSEFGKVFLKETFGQIVYTFQFMALLTFCLPQGEVSHNQVNEYRRLFNLRQSNLYKKLESLYLPDGYSLYKLLKSYTPYDLRGDFFGFLTYPTHNLAYKFIEKAKKYCN